MLTNRIKHLSGQEIAMCAEAIIDKRFGTMPVALREHLEQCDQCSAEVAMVAEIADLQQEQPAGKARDITRWMVPLLAAAFLLGFVVWVFYPSSEQLTGHESMLAVEQPAEDGTLHDEVHDTVSVEEDAQLAALADSAAKDSVTDRYKDATQDTRDHAIEPEKPQQAASQQTLLASFIPDPDMEMLAENFRSAYRGSVVRVKSPAVVSLAEHAELLWDNPEGKDLLVTISDNTGNEIISASTSSSSFEIPAISPGLYYWRLIEAEDFDLLFVGKILSEN